MRRRIEFGDLLQARGYGVAVEVGVQRGEFSDCILSRWGGTLWMVDRWCHVDGYDDIANVSDEQHEECMAAASAVAAKYPLGRAFVLRESSREAAALFKPQSVNAVYLDADHSKEAVLADLAIWLPKVRRGGVIAGHDYLDGDLPEGRFGVKSAVLEFFGREPDIVTEDEWPTWLMEVPS